MSDLIARLEAATGPDRKLDAGILLSLYPSAIIELDPAWTDSATVYHAEPLVRNKGELPAYTASIDAALKLVPEGWSYNISPDEACLTFPGHGFLSDRGDQEIYGRGRTPAIALSIAALKARGEVR